VGVKKIEKDGHLKEHLYKFTSNKTGIVYHIQLDEYNHKIYFVKFYKGQHKTHPNKFRYILNTHDAYKIIRTSINVLLEILEKSPDSSFGFMGAASVNKVKKGGNKIEETLFNTQRFRIYEYITKNYFGHLSFTHSFEKNYSCYILINNTNNNKEEYINSVGIMLNELYPSLADINS
jgi:hypothetical protein